jgi:hypothetical protein
MTLTVSLIGASKSLFWGIFSLITCIGNSPKSRCGMGISCRPTALSGVEFPEFPEKFPVCREFGWRRVRSSLRRQPRSPVFG